MGNPAYFLLYIDYLPSSCARFSCNAFGLGVRAHITLPARGLHQNHLSAALLP